MQQKQCIVCFSVLHLKTLITSTIPIKIEQIVPQTQFMTGKTETA